MLLATLATRDLNFLLFACQRLLETRPFLTLSLVSLALFSSASVLQRLKRVKPNPRDDQRPVIGALSRIDL